MLTGKFGFKVYNTTSTTVPFPKGFVKDFSIMVVDAATATMGAAALLTLIATLL